MSSYPRRGPRMTNAHKTVFVNWLKSHPDNIRLFREPRIGKRWKCKKWKEIAATLNSINSSIPKRSDDKWKKSIGDLMCKIRKRHETPGKRLDVLEKYIMKSLIAPLPAPLSENGGVLLDMSSDDDSINASSDDYCNEDIKMIPYLTEPEVTEKLEKLKGYLTEDMAEQIPEPTATNKELGSEVLLNNAKRQTAAMESIAESLVVLTKQSEQTNQTMLKCVDTLSSLVEVLSNRNKS